MQERLMQLFIMRHGQASFDCQKDAERSLTEQGTHEARVMANWMNQMEIAPTHIWVSPYKRAQQTCQAVLEVLTSKPVPTTLDFITPSGVAKNVHDYIDGELAHDVDFERLLIISHMPLVSYLVSELTQQEHAPIFQTAGICEIEYNASQMKGVFVQITSPSDLHAASDADD